MLRHRGLQSARVPSRELRSTAHAAAHGRYARLHVHLLRGKGGRLLHTVGLQAGYAGVRGVAALATQGGCNRVTANLDGGDNQGAYLDAVDARCGEGCVQLLVESGGACVVLDQSHAEERGRVPCNLRGGGSGRDDMVTAWSVRG